MRPLRRKCSGNHGFAAAADIEQGHRLGDDVAAESRIYFFYDDIEVAGAKVTHDVAHTRGGQGRRKMPGIGID